MLSNQENIKDDYEAKYRLEQALNINKPLSIAYYLKEELKQIWQQDNKEEAKKTLNNFASKMDKAASKGIFKRNTASRRISRLMKRLNSLNKA